jgi:hypothetical protein
MVSYTSFYVAPWVLRGALKEKNKHVYLAGSASLAFLCVSQQGELKTTTKHTTPKQSVSKKKKLGGVLSLSPLCMGSFKTM